MKKSAPPKTIRTPVVLTMVRRNPDFFAIAATSDGRRPRPGRGQDREGAIADALQCSRIVYSGPDVEKEVRRSEASGAKVNLILEGETLFSMPVVA